VDFDRLLLSRGEEREITLENTAFVPLAWRLDTKAFVDHGPDLSVRPVRGEIPVGGRASVVVAFDARVPEAIDTRLFVEYTDAEDGDLDGNRVQRLEVRVTAEAYLCTPRGYAESTSSRV
jgi:hypothetical protein